MLMKEKLNNGKVRVTFEIAECVWADRIALVGDFNDWDADSHPFRQSGHNPCWHISIDLEPGRTYCFRYLVDGTSWMNDDHADRYETGPSGEPNSVVVT